MKATKAQLAVDIDFDKAIYPLVAQAKTDGCRAINLDGTLKARSLKPHENLFTTEKYSKDIYLGFDCELIVGAPNEEDTLNRTSSATRLIQNCFLHKVFCLLRQGKVFRVLCSLKLIDLTGFFQHQ